MNFANKSALLIDSFFKLEADIYLYDDFMLCVFAYFEAFSRVKSSLQPFNRHAFKR